MRGLFIVLAILGVATGALAQVHPVNPTDAIYRDLDRWEVLGYLPPGYVLRPYSPEVLREALRLVLLRAEGDDRQAAERYLQQLGRPRFSPRVFSHSALRLSSADGTACCEGGAGAGLWVLNNFVDTLWLSGNAGMQFARSPGSVLPVGENFREDIITTGYNGDATTFFNGLTSALSYGGPNLWTSFSYARSSAGPFFSNGVVLGPQAMAAPNWSLHGSFGPFRISASLLQLMPLEPNADGGYSSLQFNKYLAFHSYSFALGERWDVGAYETVVWAGDFKPLYLVPFSYMYFLQASAAFADNSQGGLYARWRPLDGFAVKAVAFFDDVQAADIVKLQFDTKIIGALQVGAAWAPLAGPLALLEFDYTAVFPYMYTHWEDSFTPYGCDGTTCDTEWLQNNYTHAGHGLGAALLPNSDRWEIRGRSNLGPDLDLRALARLIRHGNASTGVPGDKGGGYFDDGRVGSDWSYQEPYPSTTTPRYFRFLTQEVLDTAVQLGATLDYDRKLGFCTVTVKLHYLFEYRWNPELVVGQAWANNYFGSDVALGF